MAILPFEVKFAHWPVNQGTPLGNSTFKSGSDRELNHCILRRHFSLNLPCSPQSSSLPLAASHPHLFQPSIIDEGEIHKLTASCFLSDREVLQWLPTADEDIPTPNTNKIVVFASFFQCGFGFLVCNFLRGLLDHYQIELVHHNPNSIL
jgi:hypothetical protein